MCKTILEHPAISNMKLSHLWMGCNKGNQLRRRIAVIFAADPGNVTTLDSSNEYISDYVVL